MSIVVVCQKIYLGPQKIDRCYINDEHLPITELIILNKVNERIFEEKCDILKPSYFPNI